MTKQDKLKDIYIIKLVIKQDLAVCVYMHIYIWHRFIRNQF